MTSPTKKEKKAAKADRKAAKAVAKAAKATAAEFADLFCVPIIILEQEEGGRDMSAEYPQLNEVTAKKQKGPKGPKAPKVVKVPKGSKPPGVPKGKVKTCSSLTSEILVVSKDGSPVDLSEKRLNQAEKVMLASSYINGEMSVREIHNKYNIPVATIYKYVKIVRDNKPMTRSTAGQPRCVLYTIVLHIFASFF